MMIMVVNGRDCKPPSKAPVLKPSVLLGLVYQLTRVMSWREQGTESLHERL